jgi:hypothetical protein
LLSSGPRTKGAAWTSASSAAKHAAATAARDTPRIMAALACRRRETGTDGARSVWRISVGTITAAVFRALRYEHRR